MMALAYDGFARAYPLPDQDEDVYEAGDGMACPEGAMLPLQTNDGEGAEQR